MSKKHNMKKLLYTLILILLMCFPALSQDIERIQEKANAIDEYISAQANLGRFNGSVLVAKGDQILVRKGFGYAEFDNLIPFTPKTKQVVASISKMFTAFAALQLQEAGKLNLTNSICNYLDGCPEAWQPIIIENLIHHTSGIPDYEEELKLGSAEYIEFMTKPNSSERIVEQAKLKPLDFAPGEKFRYSNTAYIVLSYIIEQASAKPFEKYIQEHIFKPAGMKNSGVLGSNKMPKNIASGYTQRDLTWDEFLGGHPIKKSEIKKMPVLPKSSPAGDAFMYSTLDDLYRWSRIMGGKSKLASRENINKIFGKSEKADYGYGWFTGKGFDRKRARHNGQLPGYMTEFVRFPEEDITIIIFSNVETRMMGRITRDISAIVLGTPWDMPVSGNVFELNEEHISRLLGKYKMADGKILTISKGKDYLMANLQDFYTAGLIPLSPTEFYFPLADGRAIFTLDDDGQVVKVNMRYSGEDHIAERL